MLHLLGIDHTKLTYRYAGRDFRLTDVYGERKDGPAGLRPPAVPAVLHRKIAIP